VGLRAAGIFLVVLTTMSACSRSTHSQAGPSSSVVPTVTATTLPRLPIRDCSTAAFGSGPLRINRAGPVGFVDEGARWQLPIERRGTRIRPTKILVVVANGSTVTVTVPVAEADALRLFYRQPTPPSVDGFYDMAKGDQATTFQACPRTTSVTSNAGVTQFPGYFLVDQPGCYRIDIIEHGADRRLHADLSLGRPC
jgi:hypothetical protein